eukprot:310845-Rhodomonas_salina.2
MTAGQDSIAVGDLPQGCVRHCHNCEEDAADVRYGPDQAESIMECSSELHAALNAAIAQPD